MADRGLADRGLADRGLAGRWIDRDAGTRRARGTSLIIYPRRNPDQGPTLVWVSPGVYD